MGVNRGGRGPVGRCVPVEVRAKLGNSDGKPRFAGGNDATKKAGEVTGAAAEEKVFMAVAAKRNGIREYRLCINAHDGSVLRKAASVPHSGDIGR